MFVKSSTMGCDYVRRENNKAISRFIMRVQEEDRWDNILRNVFLRSTEENPYTKQIAANIALCKAVAEEKNTKQTAERRKMVQRQTDDDLRRLEYKVRAAYVSKGVTAQSFESQQLVVEEKAKAHLENQVLHTARFQRHEHVEFRINKTQEKKQALKSELQAQIAAKESNDRKEKLKKLEDKKQMDEAVQQYKKVLLEDEIALRDKKERIRKEVNDFEEIQRKWRADHNKIDQKLQLRHQQFPSKNEDSRWKAVQEQRKQQVERALISERIGMENHKLAKIKRKSLDFLTELLVDERNANEDLKSLRQLERKLIKKINYRNDLMHQCKLKQKREINENMQQSRLQCELQLVLKAQDEVQRHKDEEKRKSNEAHRYDLLCTLNEQKRFKVNEMKRMIMTDKSEQADFQRKKMEIEKLRDEIIQDHAPALKEFFVSKDSCRQN